MIQVVGRVQETECRSCLQDMGPMREPVNAETKFL